MSRKIGILSFSYTLFLVLLFLSGSLSGIISEVVYYLAFIIPIAFSLILTRGEGDGWSKHLTIDKIGLKRTLPLIFPTVSAIILISILTSIIIFALTGRTNNVDVGDSLIIALLTHALVPAVLEEALFRYLPMRLLTPHSNRGAVIVSAFFFALVHHDLFSIPYAFLAGLIFMTIDIATESIVPSVIIHFINNALSIFMMFVANPVAILLIYILLAILTVVSIIAIRITKDEYKEALLIATDKGEGVLITTEMILFAVATLVIAVVALL